jgi:DNA-binding MarR family transcriptional regulator
MPTPAAPPNDEAIVEAVASLFPAIYRRLHSRFDVERVGVQAAALLDHLAIAGPLTIGEAAAHLGRAQSVLSEIVGALEARGLLERMRDARDRRRTLVWLTPKGREWRARAEDVLSRERLREAVAAMAPPDREALVAGMRALVLAADATYAPPTNSAPIRARAPKKKERNAP